jgi:hypothetical protein
MMHESVKNRWLLGVFLGALKKAGFYCFVCKDIYRLDTDLELNI